MSYEIYSRAIQALFKKTHGGLADRDRIKVVQLFDRLLSKGYSIDVNDLRGLCKDIGYDSYTTDNIGFLYDTLDLIRTELDSNKTIDYWPEAVTNNIINGE